MPCFKIAAISLVLAASTTPAFAGFEWIPPTAAPQAPVMAQPQPAVMESPNLVPMPDKPAAVTTTQMTTTTTTPAQPAPVAAPVVPPADVVVEQKLQNIEPSITWNEQQPTPAATAMPVSLTSPSPRVENAPRTLTPVSAAPVSSDKVEGFGRDVPLTIATRQMVPSDYVVQYGQGVDPNVIVSWTGGRSWKEALNDSLAEKNLKATIIADSVMIENVNASQQLRAEPIVAQAAAPVPLPPVNEVTLVNTTTTTTTVTPPQSPMLQNVSYAPPPAPAAPAVQVWVAPRASTLRQALTDWSREAGVQLQWSAQYDYPLMSDVQISGTFEQAVETLLSGLVDAQPRPVARLHPNAPNGPAILVVETRHILE